jgi:hypothetical protein
MSFYLYVKFDHQFFLLLLILFWILFIFFISSIDIRLIEIGFRDFSQFFYEIISFL